MVEGFSGMSCLTCMEAKKRIQSAGSTSYWVLKSSEGFNNKNFVVYRKKLKYIKKISTF